MVKSVSQAIANGGTIYRWVIGILIGVLMSATFGFITHSEWNDQALSKKFDDFQSKWIDTMIEVRGNQKTILLRLDRLDKSL